jgi:hypothetical protein
LGDAIRIDVKDGEIIKYYVEYCNHNKKSVSKELAEGLLYKDAGVINRIRGNTLFFNIKNETITVEIDRLSSIYIYENGRVRNAKFSDIRPNDFAAFQSFRATLSVMVIYR